MTRHKYSKMYHGVMFHRSETERILVGHASACECVTRDRGSDHKQNNHFSKTI
jgi:hypothetical protein